MYYFPTYVYVGSGGKEDAAITIMHTLSYRLHTLVFSLITCTIFSLM